ncbi:MAG: T9SS type A sorting domain-containing protein [Ignavibacteriales bacterium]|nr:T9SS type A sorting domain-containing protein [Ignavibacteriales bacterium]
MKNLLSVVFFLVFGIAISFGQQQDSIKSYPGIPIITYGYDLSKHPVEQFIGMDEAGIYALEASNLTAPIFNQKIGNNNLDLKVMPEQVTDPSGNYIVKYTEARYTEWEAEGTNPADGLITLYYDSINCVTPDDAVVTTSTTPNDTIIYGPMYSQEKTYSMVDRDFPINYTLVCSLKLEDLQPGQTLPGDTVCIIQVTTRTSYNLTIQQWQLGIPEKIIEKVVTYGELLPLNQWKGIDTIYNLISVPAIYSQRNEMPSQVNRKFLANGDNSIQSLPRESVHNIEFRVIWKGNSQKLRLSVDKFIVYDWKGWDLMNLLGPTTQISTQLSNNQSAFNNQVAGWIGFDEPWDLDTWAPIKKVKEILESNSPNASIWFQFNTKWNGRFSDYDDPSYSAKRIIIDEFMRRVKKANVWVTSWLYDMPCDDYDIVDPCDGDYKEINIDFAADSIYKKILDASLIHPDLFYGMSIQTGRYFDRETYDGNDRIREISGSDLLYQTNLALMYGAKLISPWLYFGEKNEAPETREYTGFRNPPGYPETDKYLMLKNTIAQRLSGLMGRTLKTLTPTSQHLNHQLNTSQGFIQSIVEGNCTAEGMQSGDEAYDLGFFKDDLDRDYFMLISRWYNPICSPSLTININPLSFPNNYNLKAINMINNISTTITKYGNLSTAIEVGDACFFSVAPVVKYGGSITNNDTIKTNTSLIDNMTINNTKTIIINSEKEYTIQDTVTLLGTGFITGEGYVNLTSAGEIIINSWDYSLFKAKSNNHPKLIWGKHPGTLTVSYYSVYRKIGAGSWQFLANTTSKNYTDQSLGIVPPNGQAGTMVYYKLIAVFVNETESSYSNIVQFDCSIKQIEKKIGEEGIIYTYALAQNYPNPFNPSTTINYSLAEDGVVELEIVNILGERIITLVNEFQIKGNHNINFDASHLSSGIYIYKIQAGDFISSRKMIFLK